MASAYELAWDETSLPSKLVFIGKKIRENASRMRSPELQTKTFGYVSLASAFYTVAGTAGKKLKAAVKPVRVLSIFLLPLWFVTWLPLGLLCHLIALLLVRSVLKRIVYDPQNSPHTGVFGCDVLSADQYDICQSILLRRFISREQNYRRAEACIRAGLDKPSMAAHTRGLLHIGMARVYCYKADWWDAEKEIAKALSAAKEAAEKDPRQASRVYRGVADMTRRIDKVFKRTGPGREEQLRNLLSRAHALAASVGAKDQILKQL